MPFCTQCGTAVQPTDAFCAGCGAAQAGAARPKPEPAPATGKKEFLRDMPARRAAFLCYIPIVGWVFAIVMLASDRFREDRMVRFHAFQGLYLFVLWLFVEWVFEPIAAYSTPTHHMGDLFKLVVLGAWIFMMIKTKQGDDFRLPLLGELADRSVSEQR